MTYPPQQPGPYGQQNPWGQPPPGQFPPQQAASQTPPWLTGGPGGFPEFEPEPRKSRGGLIAVVVIVALLVLGGGGFGLWVLLSKDDEPAGGDARAVAEKYVDELQALVGTNIEDIELSSMEPVTCADDFERMEQQIGEAQESGDFSAAQPGSIEVGIKDFESTGDKASFTLTQKLDGKEAPDQQMTMAKEEGAWKVCGLFGTNPPEADEPTEGDEPTDEPTGDPPPSDGQVPNPIPTT